MDVICLDENISEACATQELSDESDDLLPDYPVPYLGTVAHGQPVNTAPFALPEPDRVVAVPAHNETVPPDFGGRKGRGKPTSSRLERDELQAQRMEKRAKQVAERAERRLHKEMEKQLKQAEKDARREGSSGERQKHLVVLLDSRLSENTVLMQELVVRMAQYDITHRSVSHPTPATVRWTRVVNQRTIDDTAQLLVRKEEKEEAIVLAQLEAVEFAALICGNIAGRKGGLVGAHSSLTGYVTHLHQVYPLCKIILVVMGMEAYHRNVKTKKNRKFREQVRSQASSSSQAVSSSHEPVVSKDDVHEAVVGLQLQTASVVRLVEDEGCFADLVVCYTRAIADAPFKKNDLFSFHAECNSRLTKKSSGVEDVSLTWQHMLMQFNHVSVQVANAIVSVYPSPSSLLKTYSKCGTPKEAELLLQDIVIRRGVGVTASSRRVGPVLSRRIYTYLTSPHGETMLH